MELWLSREMLPDSAEATEWGGGQENVQVQQWRVLSSEFLLLSNFPSVSCFIVRFLAAWNGMGPEPTRVTILVKSAEARATEYKSKVPD